MAAHNPRQMALFILLVATSSALGASNRCSYKTNNSWAHDDANLLHVHNATTDTVWVAADPGAPLGQGHNETWVRMSVTSSMWEGGIMDCNARDDLVVPDYYGGDPEAGQVWYDCTARPGMGKLPGASTYWLQVAVNGIAPGNSQQWFPYSCMTFNETFTCEDDPNIMYVGGHGRSDQSPSIFFRTSTFLHASIACV